MTKRTHKPTDNTVPSAAPGSDPGHPVQGDKLGNPAPTGATGPKQAVPGNMDHLVRQDLPPEDHDKPGNVPVRDYD